MEIDKRIRLAYYTDFLAVGGAEEYLYFLMEQLDQEKYKLAFFCPEHQLFQPFVQRIRRLGVDVGMFPLVDSSLASMRYVKNLFKRHGIQIAHINHLTTKGILAARWAQTPIIVLTNHTPALEPKYNWRGRLLEKLALHSIDAMVVLSKANKQTALDKHNLGSNKVKVVHLGLPSKKFAGDFNRDDVFHELEIPLDWKIIGTIGRLVPQKAHRDLIQAAKMICKAFPKVMFIIVGDGELREELTQLAKEQGIEKQIIFTGYRSDIPRLLNAFDIFALSSLFEGLPAVVLEAMAMSKPVIATDVDGVAEAMVDGLTGIVIPPRNPQALTDAATQLLNNSPLACRMGQAGRKRFEQLFTQNTMVERTQQLYETLLEKRG